MSGQRSGFKRLESELSQETKPLKLKYAIKNIMRDESTFELSFQDCIRASYSILGSHAQLTYRAQGSDVVHDEHMFRSPAVLSPVMNSATMHEALSAGPGGFAQTLRGNIGFLATITTSDAHAANIRLLKFVDQQLEPNHFFIPNLCLQHRVGNIIEQLTKFLGNLGGNFSISKVLNKGNLLKALRKKAGASLRERLLVLEETPPAVIEEWRQAQEIAQDMVDLCMSFHEADPARSGTHREAFQRFKNFFAGPWTGRSEAAKEAAVSDLGKALVTDSYGIGASGQIDKLTENGISGILAASAHPPVVRDSRIEHLGVYDGTGAACGDLDPGLLVGVFNRILILLASGSKVLISCKNGAHRSSFLMGLFLIFLTGAQADDVEQYLQRLRAIVDLNTYAPESKWSKGRDRIKPIQALRQMHEFFCTQGVRSLSRLTRPAQDALGFSQAYENRPSLNCLMNPAEFQSLAVSLGWVAVVSLSEVGRDWRDLGNTTDDERGSLFKFKDATGRPVMKPKPKERPRKRPSAEAASSSEDNAGASWYNIASSEAEQASGLSTVESFDMVSIASSGGSQTKRPSRAQSAEGRFQTRAPEPPQGPPPARSRSGSAKGRSQTGVQEPPGPPPGWSGAESAGRRSQTGGPSPASSRAQSEGARPRASSSGPKGATPAGSAVGTPRTGFVQEDFEILKAMVEELGNLDRQLAGSKKSSPAASLGDNDNDGIGNDDTAAAGESDVDWGDDAQDASMGKTCLDIALKCSLDVANYLTWWEAPSYHPPPEAPPKKTVVAASFRGLVDDAGQPAHVCRNGCCQTAEEARGKAEGLFSECLLRPIAVPALNKWTKVFPCIGACVLLASFSDIGQQAFQQQFGNLGPEALSEQENSGDAEDEALKVPINEVERWKKLARKRNAKAQRFLCDDDSRFVNMLWLHIAAPCMRLHWILFKTCTWFSDRPKVNDSANGVEVPLSLGQFCSARKNPGYKVVADLFQQLRQPSVGYKMLSFFHGAFEEWPQARKRIALRSTLVTIGQLLRKVVEPFSVYPWKLWDMVDPAAGDMQRTVVVRELFKASPCCLDSGCTAKIRASMDEASCLEQDFRDFLHTTFERIVLTSTFIERKFSHFTHWTDVKGKGSSLGALAAKHVTRSFKDAVEFWKKRRFGEESCQPQNKSRPSWRRKDETAARLNGYHMFLKETRAARTKPCRGAEEAEVFLKHSTEQWQNLTRQQKQALSLLARKLGSNVTFEHLFSCESNPEKMQWISAVTQLAGEVTASIAEDSSTGDRPPEPCLFCDICELGRPHAACAAHKGNGVSHHGHGSENKIDEVSDRDKLPEGHCYVPQVDILVLGTSCKDMSRANHPKSSARGGSQNSQSLVLSMESSKGGSAQTFRGMLAYCEKNSPAIVIFENVDAIDDRQGGSSNLDILLADAMLSQEMGNRGYESQVIMTDAAMMGLPARRRRVYIVFLKIAGNSLVEFGGSRSVSSMFTTLRAVMCSCLRSPCCATKIFLPAKDPSTVAELENRRSKREKATEATKKGLPQPQTWMDQHLAFAKSLKFRWGQAIPENLRENAWFLILTEREKDALRLARVQNPALLFRDLSQSVARVNSNTANEEGHILPTLLPKMLLWCEKEARIMLGREALMCQGFPALPFLAALDKQRPQAGTSSADRPPAWYPGEILMADLAGNAMALPVVLAILQSTFVALSWKEEAADSPPRLRRTRAIRDEDIDEALSAVETLLRMAIEQLSTAATDHSAHFFFTNRTAISAVMHDRLNKHLQDRAFSEVPFFQLRTVHLPSEFEEAIRETQLKQQDIQIAGLEQKTKTVTFKTRVLQAEQEVKVLINQAEAEAASINATNRAYCRQYKVTQDLQTSALSQMVAASGWDAPQLLDYMRVRAFRGHPANKSTVRF
ncbi:SSRP1 [Symbiodinium sp. KB8]|nr:SSRP1 [Symbiodinium sp. KB8]